MTFLFVYFVLFVVNGCFFVVFGALERAWRPVLQKEEPDRWRIA